MLVSALPKLVRHLVQVHAGVLWLCSPLSGLLRVAGGSHRSEEIGTNSIQPQGYRDPGSLPGTACCMLRHHIAVDVQSSMPNNQ